MSQSSENDNYQYDPKADIERKELEEEIVFF